MASVNFVKQIKERNKRGEQSEVEIELSEEGPENLATRIRKLTEGNSEKPEPRDIVLFIFAAIVFIGSNFKEGILQSFFRKDRLVIVEQKLSEIQSQIEEQDKKIAGFEGIKTEIDAYERQVADFNQKLNLIHSVKVGRNSIVRMIDFIVKNMPSGVWLNQIDIKLTQTAGTSGIGNYGNISVDGFADSHQEISNFLSQLEGTSFFPEWKLSESLSTTDSSTQGASAPPLNSKKFNVKAEVVQL
jgi:hypothetical protein